VDVFWTEFTGQGNEFELIQTVKMKTRHPVEAYFGNKFPSICNHCVSYGDLKSQDVEKKSFFLHFKKRLLLENFLKFCSERIHRLTDRRVIFKFHEIWPTGNR